jgi:hypothetical protein
MTLPLATSPVRFPVRYGVVFPLEGTGAHRVGGTPMPDSVSQKEPLVTPTEVWEALSTDLQVQAIRLLARLACAAMSSAAPVKEKDDVLAQFQPQDPPHPS